LIQRVGNVKTDASGKMIPLDDALIEQLLSRRAETPHAADSDYVFASWKLRGNQPLWMSRVTQPHIKPVAADLGIPLKGFHTLRHSSTHS
jgi:integrase